MNLKEGNSFKEGYLEKYKNHQLVITILELIIFNIHKFNNFKIKHLEYLLNCN